MAAGYVPQPPSRESVISEVRAQIEKNTQTIKELMAMGTPDNPIEEDMVDPSERVKAGFAPNPDEYLVDHVTKAKKYQQAKIIDGKLTGQAADGKWYRDSAGALPWAERHLADLPETGLMVGGGMLGGYLGGATGGAALGGAGATVGNYIKQGIGELSGVRDSIDHNEAAHAFRGGALADLGGRAVGLGAEGAGKLLAMGGEKIPLKFLGGENLTESSGIASDAVKNWLRTQLARTTGFVSGIGTPAMQNLLARRKQTLSGLDNLDSVGEQAGEALKQSIRDEGEKISNVREGFKQRQGGRVALKTDDLLGLGDEAQAKYATNDHGQGPMTEDELQELSKLQKSLTTPVTGIAPQPGAVSTEPLQIQTQMYRQKSVPPKGSSVKKLAKGDLVSPEIRMSPVEPQLEYGDKGPAQTVQDPIYGTPRLDIDPVQLQTIREILAPTLRKGSSKVVAPEVRSNPLNFDWMPDSHPQLVGGVQSQMPYQDPVSLQQTADSLGNEVGPAAWLSKDKAAARTPRFTGQQERMYGAIKAKLHLLDKPLAEGDAAYSEWAKKAKLLNPLTDPATREGFIKQLYQGKKQATVDAAKAILPQETMDQVGDAAAASALDGKHILGTPLTTRDLLSMSLVGGEEGARRNDKNNLAALLGTAAVITNPRAYKYGFGYGAPLAGEALKRLPGAAMYNSTPNVQAPWSLLMDYLSKEKKDGEN